MIKFVNEPDWTGDFTRDQADGAIPNGTPIQKINSEDKDAHPNGSRGVVLGSVDLRGLGPTPAGCMPTDFVYWVEWQEKPKHAIFVIGSKIARLA